MSWQVVVLVLGIVWAVALVLIAQSRVEARKFAAQAAQANLDAARAPRTARA